MLQIIRLPRQRHLSRGQFGKLFPRRDVDRLAFAVHTNEDILSLRLARAVRTCTLFRQVDLASSMVLVTVAALNEPALRAKKSAGRTAVMSEQPFLVHATEDYERNSSAGSAHRHVVTVDLVATADQPIVNRIYRCTIKRRS